MRKKRNGALKRKEKLKVEEFKHKNTEKKKKTIFYFSTYKCLLLARFDQNYNTIIISLWTNPTCLLV